MCFLCHFIEKCNLEARFASYIVLLRMIQYTPPAGRREKRRQGKVHDKEDLCNFAPPQNIGQRKQYTYIYK